MTTPAQVVRLVTAQPATGTSLATPTVYRLVQPAASIGQPMVAAQAQAGQAAAAPAATPAATATAQPPAAPQKKSVALMLTVSFFFSVRRQHLNF